MDNRNLFIVKLDRFIRKYYRNKLFRGILLCLLFILVYVGVALVSEYVFYLSIKVKTIVWVITLVLLLLVIFNFIVLPLFGLLKIGKRISYKQAIGIISKHFPNLQDKLVNTLELTQLSEKDKTADNTLLLASINQRIEAIRPVTFRKAIDLKSNFKYLRYLLLLLAVAVATWYFYPDVIADSSTRLVNYNRTYLPPDDFTFHLKNRELTVEKGEDITVQLSTTGKYIPVEAYIVFNGTRFLMKHEPDNSFTYTFRAVYSPINFKVESGDVSSKNYKIDLLQRPMVADMRLTVLAPSYTKIPVVKSQNIGDISVPQGATVKWHIATEWTDSLRFVLDKTMQLKAKQIGENKFTLSKRFLKPVSYNVILANENFPKSLFAKYHIDITPDIYPQIKVHQKRDSSILSGYYFRGIVKDDYGFSKLRFVYQVENLPAVYRNITLKKQETTQQFFFAFDFATANLPEGTKVNYFFEVFDNDAVNGAKKSVSQHFSYHIPSEKQLYDLNTTIQDSINSKIKQSLDLSKDIQKDIQRLQKNMLDGATEKWQQQQAVKEIAEKKEQLNQLMKEISKENQQKNSLENAAGINDPELMEKQKQIEDLMQKVMNPELQELFDEFKKLSEQMKNDELNKVGNDLKMSMDDFRKQMDRNLQLLERYEVEMRVKQLTQRLNNLAETLQNKSPKDKDLELVEQESDSKWNDLKKDLSDLLNKNNSIKKPFELGDKKPSIERISEQMKQTNGLMQQQKNRKAAKSMQKAAQQQKQLASQLTEAMQKSLNAQMSIDMEGITRLLNNLITFSFQQEEVILNYNKVEYNNPQYVELVERQGRLKDKYTVLQDSLQALSARSAQVAHLIGGKVIDIKNNLNKAVDNANERYRYQANIAQRNVLTGINDLCVFLSEALQQLMKQMSESMPGDQNCDNPGKGKSKFPSLKAQQKSLKQMLESMISQMKSGKEKKGMGKKMGQFLQQQEMYQQKLREMLKNEGLSQVGEKKIREIIQMIDQNISEISNFSINSSTIFRQSRILTKLLEAEKAENQRGYEEKREGKVAKSYKLSNPSDIFEYKNKKSSYNSMYYNSKVKLMNYYNKLYLDYMIKLDDD